MRPLTIELLLGELDMAHGGGLIRLRDNRFGGLFAVLGALLALSGRLRHCVSGD